VCCVDVFLAFWCCEGAWFGLSDSLSRPTTMSKPANEKVDRAIFRLVSSIKIFKGSSNYCVRVRVRGRSMIFIYYSWRAVSYHSPMCLMFLLTCFTVLTSGWFCYILTVLSLSPVLWCYKPAVTRIAYVIHHSRLCALVRVLGASNDQPLNEWMAKAGICPFSTFHTLHTMPNQVSAPTRKTLAQSRYHAGKGAPHSKDNLWVWVLRKEKRGHAACACTCTHGKPTKMATSDQRPDFLPLMANHSPNNN